MTTSYFDSAAAAAGAEAGIQRSFDNASETAKAAARAAIEAVARREAYFTSEDVWAEMEAAGATGYDPSQGSFLGHVLRAVAKEHLIELAEGVVRPSARPANHLRILRVWRSRISQSPQAQCCPTCGRATATQLAA